MSKRARIGIWIVGIGLVLAVLGILVTGRFFRQTLASAAVVTQSPAETEPVVVAARGVAMGTVLQADDLRLAEMPAGFVPEGSLSSLESAVGRFAKVDFVAGETIFPQKLADPTNQNHDVGFALQQDEVLIAFPASDLISTLSFLKQGDVVDIFATIEDTAPAGDTEPAVQATEQPDDSTRRMLTFDSMQRVQLTAMIVEVEENEQPAVPLNTGAPESQAKSSNAKVRSYLLALKPQDALVLKYLKDTGAIFDIALRPPNAEQLYDLQPVTKEYVQDRYQFRDQP